MASIIMMKSDEFLDSFLKKYNHENFNFILVSADIKTDYKFKNVFKIKQLLPPTKAISCKLNGNDYDEYRKKYIKHLARPDIEIFITTIVKLAVAENSNVVLLCSKDEHSNLKYLNILREYIEEVYGVNVFTYKKYKKTEKPTSVISKKKTIKIIAKKIEHAASENVQVNLDRDEVVGRLKHMSKESVYKFAKSNGIKVKKDMDKKELLKKIYKKIK